MRERCGEIEPRKRGRKHVHLLVCMWKLIYIHGKNEEEKNCMCTCRRIVCGVCVWARHRGSQVPPSLIRCRSGILDLRLSKLIEYYFQEDAADFFFNLHLLWNQLSYCRRRSVFPGENGIYQIVILSLLLTKKWMNYMDFFLPAKYRPLLAYAY